MRSHRRRIRPETFTELSPWGRRVVGQLIPLLRLAVLLNRPRAGEATPQMSVKAEPPQLKLSFPPGYLEEHPLTRADLQGEIEALAAIGVLLHYE